MADSTRDDDEGLSPGWEAISARLRTLYPDKKEWHWGTVISFMLGGRDPLDGISAYLHDDANGQSHWHYVSFGLSELYEKRSELQEISGWGIEFTFRLARESAEDEPPQWPLGLFQNLARYVFKTGNVFGPGHYLPLNSPIALERETDIRAAMFVEDAELKPIDTPNGHLQIVGATIDEMVAASAWNTLGFLQVMSETNPLLVTDLGRKSILFDPEVSSRVAAGTARDGSSSASCFVRELSVRMERDKSHTLVLGASGVGNIQGLLRGRIPFERTFHIVGPDLTVVFSAADQFRFDTNAAEKTVNISLTVRMAEELAGAIRPLRGDYHAISVPNLSIQVVPTNILDDRGEKVVEVIG
jgi:suppressor of fused-like protein